MKGQVTAQVMYIACVMVLGGIDRGGGVPGMVSRRRSRRGRPYGWRQWLLSALIIVSTTPVAWALWHLAPD